MLNLWEATLNHKPLSSLCIKSTHVARKLRDVDPSVIVHLTFNSIGLGHWVRWHQVCMDCTWVRNTCSKAQFKKHTILSIVCFLNCALDNWWISFVWFPGNSATSQIWRRNFGAPFLLLPSTCCKQSTQLSHVHVIIFSERNNFLNKVYHGARLVNFCCCRLVCDSKCLLFLFSLF